MSTGVHADHVIIRWILYAAWLVCAIHILDLLTVPFSRRTPAEKIGRVASLVRAITWIVALFTRWPYSYRAWAYLVYLAIGGAQVVVYLFVICRVVYHSQSPRIVLRGLCAGLPLSAHLVCLVLFCGVVQTKLAHGTLLRGPELPVILELVCTLGQFSGSLRWTYTFFAVAVWYAFLREEPAPACLEACAVAYVLRWWHMPFSAWVYFKAYISRVPDLSGVPNGPVPDHLRTRLSDPD